MTLPKLFITLIFITVVPSFILTQNCFPETDNVDVYSKAISSPITVLAKVKSTSAKKHVFQISAVYKINNGGLKKRQKINIGPISVEPGCPVLKKKSEFLLFLKEKADGESFYQFYFNPQSISKKIKKTMPKVVCSGCVKAPKFPKSREKKKVQEIALKAKYAITCKAKGNPKPTMQVWKDGEVLVSAKGVKVSISKKGGRASISFKSVKKEHFGVYTCGATNAGGSQNITEELILVDSCVPCNETMYKNYCKNGKCCWSHDVSAALCKCEKDYEGTRCEKKIFKVLIPRDNDLARAGADRKVIAIMALIMALIVCGIVCYIVYCKSKKPKSMIQNRRQRRSNARAANQGAEMTSMQTRTSTSAAGNNNSNSIAQHPNTYEHTVPTASGPENSSQADRLRTEDDRSSNNSPQGRKRINGHSFNTGDRKTNREINTSYSNNTPSVAYNGEPQNVSHDTTMNVANNILAKQSVPSNFSSTASMVEGENKYSHEYRAHPELPFSSTVDHIINQNIQHPPSYISVGKDNDFTEGRMPPVSPSSPHKVTTFENDGQVKEMTVDRVTGVTPHSPKLTPLNLQRQNRVYSSEQPESPRSLASPTYENQPLVSSTSRDEDEENGNQMYLDHHNIESDNDEFTEEEEMKQPLYQSVKSSQAHQIPLTSQRSSNSALPTVPLSSSSSIEDETESQNRSINV